jgi:hypothetical protein
MVCAILFISQWFEVSRQAVEHSLKNIDIAK